MKLFISSVFLANLIAAEVEPFMWRKRCPDVSGSSNFELNSYLGQWYNIANSPFFWMSNKNTCPTANYQLNDDGSIKVTNGEISRWTHRRNPLEGQAVVTPEDGVISVGFGPIKARADDGNYFILNTDNDNFSYVWSCSDYCIFNWCVGHRPILWILNRNPYHTDEEVNAQIDNAFDILGDEFGYDQQSMDKLRNKMHLSIHEDCDYDESVSDQN